MQSMLTQNKQKRHQHWNQNKFIKLFKILKLYEYIVIFYVSQTLFAIIEYSCTNLCAAVKCNLQNAVFVSHSSSVSEVNKGTMLHKFPVDNEREVGNYMVQKMPTKYTKIFSNYCKVQSYYKWYTQCTQMSYK